MLVSLNKTNVRNLIQSFGTKDADRWVGLEVELYLGQLQYQGALQDAVLVRGLEKPPAAATAASTAATAEASLLDPSDQIPQL
jgi:hypothetical protein